MMNATAWLMVGILGENMHQYTYNPEFDIMIAVAHIIKKARQVLLTDVLPGDVLNALCEEVKRWFEAAPFTYRSLESLENSTCNLRVEKHNRDWILLLIDASSTTL